MCSAITKMWQEGKLTPGEAIEMIKQFREELTVIENDVKDIMYDRIIANEGPVIDNGVLFSLRRGYSYRTLNSDVIKSLFPYEDNPNFYNKKETVVEEGVTMKVLPKEQ